MYKVDTITAKQRLLKYGYVPRQAHDEAEQYWLATWHPKIQELSKELKRQLIPQIEAGLEKKGVLKHHKFYPESFSVSVVKKLIGGPAFELSFDFWLINKKTKAVKSCSGKAFFEGEPLRSTHVTSIYVSDNLDKGKVFSELTIHKMPAIGFLFRGRTQIVDVDLGWTQEKMFEIHYEEK